MDFVHYRDVPRDILEGAKDFGSLHQVERGDVNARAATMG